MEGILKECDNDIIKAIQRLYKAKNTSTYNPFASNNQENRQDQMNCSFSSQGNKYNQTMADDTGIRRRRKFNEMSCDSPVSHKTVSEDGDEEEKEPIQSAFNEEKLCDDYSNYLLSQLKTIPNDESAFMMIKKCMSAYKQHGVHSKPPSSEPAKRKITDKERKMIADAVKKLSQDNVCLKNAVRKLFEREEKNAEKLSQFDNLANAYQQLSQENAKLRNAVDILKYAARDKCQDVNLDYPSNNDFSGGSGVF